MSDGTLDTDVRLPLIGFHIFGSYPFIILGVLLLASRWIASPPSTMPTTWASSSLYASVYQVALVGGVGLVVVGTVNTVILWNEFRKSDGENA